MKVIGQIIGKIGETDMLAIKATKASMVFDGGEVRGLFSVPNIVNFNANTGVPEFERLNSLVTLLDIAASKGRNVGCQ